MIIPDQDWIVDGRRVGQIKDGCAWLDNAADFPLVKDKPIPGDPVRRELTLSRVVGSRGAFVFRGLPLRERAMAPCPPDSELMKAWNAYQATDDFKNSLYWATTENRMRPERAEELGVDPGANVASPETRAERTQGSLWAAFTAGFAAAGGKTTF